MPMTSSVSGRKGSSRSVTRTRYSGWSTTQQSGIGASYRRTVWREPYMPLEEVRSEMKRMRFYGFRKDMELRGVMGKERVADTTLIRHAYVSTGSQGKGIGSTLLGFIEKQVDTEWLLVGTWQAATWAIAFYRKHGYELMERKDELLRRYWDIPDRQIETSVVLGKRMRS